MHCYNVCFGSNCSLFHVYCDLSVRLSPSWQHPIIHSGPPRLNHHILIITCQIADPKYPKRIIKKTQHVFPALALNSSFDLPRFQECVFFSAERLASGSRAKQHRSGKNVQGLWKGKLLKDCCVSFSFNMID